MEESIFYADKIMVMGNSKNLRAHVFNFAILLKSRKSQTFYAREIYMFYSMWYHLSYPAFLASSSITYLSSSAQGTMASGLQ